MRTLVTMLLFAGLATAQSVVPPFNVDYQIADLGVVSGISSYGGTAFSPTNPNVLLVSPWPSTTLRSVPVLRNPQGGITGFGAATPVITVGGTDGGLAVGPNNVLFATWYGPNRMSQIKPGSSATDRVDDLTPLGVASTVGSCAFVPAGLPGAGRFKVGSYGNGRVYDIPLTPDGNGTFALGNATSNEQTGVSIEAMVYMPATAPLLGGQLLIGDFSSNNLFSFQTDAIGNPILNSRTLVASGMFSCGGGAVDPISGDVVFCCSGGRMLLLRNQSVCGTITGYGVGTPGAAGVPLISGTGCARLGQTVTLATQHAPNSIGLLAIGVTQTNFLYQGLTVLQSLDATVVSVTDGSGLWSLNLAIPTTPALGNSRCYFQAAYLDVGTPSGLCASSGLNVLIR